MKRIKVQISAILINTLLVIFIIFSLFIGEISIVSADSGDILGCTDPTADNYDPEATVLDGTCFYSIPGCSDPETINFNPDANMDDGSCAYNNIYDPVISVFPDKQRHYIEANG